MIKRFIIVSKTFCFRIASFRVVIIGERLFYCGERCLLLVDQGGATPLYQQTIGCPIAPPRPSGRGPHTSSRTSWDFPLRYGVLRSPSRPNRLINNTERPPMRIRREAGTLIPHLLMSCSATYSQAPTSSTESSSTFLLSRARARCRVPQDGARAGAPRARRRRAHRSPGGGA